MPRRRSRISAKRNASQLARAPGAARASSACASSFPALISRSMAASNCSASKTSNQAKPREFARGELFNGFLDVFGGGQVGDIALARGTEKMCRARQRKVLRRSVRIIGGIRFAIPPYELKIDRAQIFASLTVCKQLRGHSQCRLRLSFRHPTVVFPKSAYIPVVACAAYKQFEGSNYG
jgi:hypothetical protein